MVLGEVIKNCPLTEISDHKQFLFLEVMSYLWSKCNGMKDSKGVRGYSCCCTNCLGQEHFSKAHPLHGRTFGCGLGFVPCLGGNRVVVLPLTALKQEQVKPGFTNYQPRGLA